MRAQFPVSHHDQQLVADNGEDRVVVGTSVISDAVTVDLERDPMITRARAAFTGTRDAPALELALTVADDIDMGKIRGRVVPEVVERAEAAAETESITPHVVLTLTGTVRRRLA